MEPVRLIVFPRVPDTNTLGAPASTFAYVCADERQAKNVWFSQYMPYVHEFNRFVWWLTHVELLL